jgi:hypothetical protein
MTNDIHQLLNPDFNRFFKAKSDFMMYYDADWEHEKNSDSVVSILTMLYMNRLSLARSVSQRQSSSSAPKHEDKPTPRC